MNENSQTLAQFIAAHAPGHRFGTKALHDLVDGIRKTGKGGSIAFTIKIAPDPKRSNALLVSDSVTSKVPQFDPPQRLTWLLPSGEVIDHDPNQLRLDIEARTTSTKSSTTETGGGVFDQDAPALEDLSDEERAAHAEQQRRLAEFTADAFSREAPAGDDDAADPDGQLADAGVGRPDFDPTDPDAAPMFLEGGDLPRDVTADDFDTSTAMALADAAEAKPDNVTDIASKPPRKRAPSKRKTAAAAAAAE